MTLSLLDAAVVLAAYLVGSLSFAVIVSRLMGLDDPRSYGSGNPGATNVLRSGNRWAALLTLLFDALKGWLPVLLVRLYGQALGLGEQTLPLVALAAFLGHLYPVFFRFQGGKGVATAAGVLYGLDPLLGSAVLLTWLTVAVVTRYSSLSALLAALAAPLVYATGGSVLGWSPDETTLGSVALMSALLIWRHRANILRLVQGQEGKIGQK